LKENLARGHARRQGFFNEVRSEMHKEKPDIERVSGIIKQNLNDIPQHIERDIDLFVLFYKSLDENQQKQVLATLQKRMKCASF